MFEACMRLGHYWPLYDFEERRRRFGFIPGAYSSSFAIVFVFVLLGFEVFQMGSFNHILDDEQMLDRSFKHLDRDGDERISIDELLIAMENRTDIMSSMESVTKHFHQTIETETVSSEVPSSPKVFITLREFTCACSRIPRFMGHRIEWARSLHLDLMLAERLKAGVLWDGLLGLKEMERSEVEKLCSDFARDVHREVIKHWEFLQDDRNSPSSTAPTEQDQIQTMSEQSAKLPHPKETYDTVQSMMSKFRAESGSAGKFGSKELFDKGLEAQLGIADPCILRAILREHNSKEGFMTSNYRIYTSPVVEYARVFGNECLETPATESRETFLLSKAKDLDPNYPSEAELMGLKDMLDNINVVHSSMLDKRGLFPGEIGSRIWETQAVFFVPDPSQSNSDSSVEKEQSSFAVNQKVCETELSRFVMNQKIFEKNESCLLGVGMDLSLIEGYSELLRLVVTLQFSGESAEAKRSEILEDLKKSLKAKQIEMFENQESSQDPGNISVFLQSCGETRNAARSEKLVDLKRVIESKQIEWGRWTQTIERCFIYCLHVDKSGFKSCLSDQKERDLEKLGFSSIYLAHLSNMGETRSAVASLEESNALDAALVAEFDKETEFLSKMNCFRRQGRRKLTISGLMNDAKVREAMLRVEEVVQAYQYTGPLFQIWNGVLRRMPFSKTDGLNKYTTSIHTLVSAVVKLSRKTVIPVSRKVYRGLGGLTLDDQWFEEDERGVKGAVELGFLSTTFNRSVALMYSGVKRNKGVVFEIDIGSIDCGAQLNNVSQYPGEDEMLFGPLSNLETTGTRLETFEGKNVIVVGLKINSNLKASEIDDMIGKRKQMLASIRDSACEELAFDIKILAFDEIASLISADIDGITESEVQQVKDELQDELEDTFERKKSDWFNSDENFKLVLEQISGIKRSKIRSLIRRWKKKNDLKKGFESGTFILQQAVLRMAMRGRGDLIQILRVSGATLHGLVDEQGRNLLHLACENGAQELVLKILHDRNFAKNHLKAIFLLLSGLPLLSIFILIMGISSCLKYNLFFNVKFHEENFQDQCIGFITFGVILLIGSLVMSLGGWVVLVYGSGRNVGLIKVQPGSSSIFTFFESIRKVIKKKKLGPIWNYLQDSSKVNINAQDNFGSTPLHYASKKGELDILCILLNFKAKENLKDKDGKLPVDVARDEKVRSLLLPDDAENSSKADGEDPAGVVELGFHFGNP